MVSRFVFGAFILLLVAPAVAQHGPDRATIMRILQERVDTYQRSVGLVVGVLDASGEQFFAYGLTRRDSGSQVDEYTVYEIGSITKTFTAIILADLVERGEVGLDTPVAECLRRPARLPQRKGKGITLGSLATHTSGLPRMPADFAPASASNPYAGFTTAQMFTFLRSYQLPRDVGRRYEYSNIGYGLLGHALSRFTGKPYEALVVDNLCEPLGMHDTRVVLSPAQQDRLAQGHNQGGAPVSNWDMPALAGAGAFRSTAADMVKFLAANLGLVETALQPALLTVQQSRSKTGVSRMRIALGWHITRRHGSEIVWHNGGTGGYRSFAGFDAKRKVGVVVLSNAANSVDDIGFHLLNSKFPLAELEPVRQEITIASDLLQAYVGRYALSPKNILTVTREGDALFAQFSGQARYRIYPESDSKFFYKIVDAQLSFIRDSDGQVTYVILHQNGRVQKADRLEAGSAK